MNALFRSVAVEEKPNSGDDNDRMMTTGHVECITTTITTQSTQRDHDNVVSPSLMTVENSSVYSTPILGVD